jgi:hypothetical protein
MAKGKKAQEKYKIITQVMQQFYMGLQVYTPGTPEEEQIKNISIRCTGNLMRTIRKALEA